MTAAIAFAGYLGFGGVGQSLERVNPFLIPKSPLNINPFMGEVS
jgi:hypothetical protein